MVVFGQNGFIRAKVVVFRQSSVFGKSDCIRTKVVVIGQGLLYSCKVVVIGIKRLHSGKSGCTRTKWLCSG